MSLDINPGVVGEEVYAITTDVFTALIDHEPGVLQLWNDPKPELAEPVYSWVDMAGEDASRVLVAAEKETADDVARALLAMEPDEAVSKEDLVDAVGEIANVVGGNLKSLVPHPGKLSLPNVKNAPPEDEQAKFLSEVLMSWKGRILIISIWALPPTEGDD